MVLSGEKWLCLAKVIVFGKSGCIRAKTVVVMQKWLYSGESGCTRSKVVVFGQSGCIRLIDLVFIKTGGIRAK